jgi:hypothetical protein
VLPELGRALSALVPNPDKRILSSSLWRSHVCLGGTALRAVQEPPKQGNVCPSLLSERAALTSPSLLALIDIEQREGLDTSMYRTDLWALHWGWYVLVARGLLVFLANLLRDRSKKQDASPVPPETL